MFIALHLRREYESLIISHISASASSAAREAARPPQSAAAIGCCLLPIEYHPKMRSHLEFVSTYFPALPEEDEGVNPGLYGKRLAEFLSNELPRRGFSITGMNPEDWGWRIDLRNPAFPLWIGCGPSLAYQDGFLCFIEPSRPFVRRLFRKIPTTEIVERLATTLQSIFEETGKVQQLHWWREDEVPR